MSRSFGGIKGIAAIRTARDLTLAEDLALLLLAAFLVIQLVLVSVPAHADDTKCAILDWDPVVLNQDGTPANDVDHYKVYIGQASQSYATSLAVGNVITHTACNLMPGQTYFFAVSAFDIAGNESSLSQEVSLTVPTPSSGGGGGSGGGGAGNSLGNAANDFSGAGTSSILTAQIVKVAKVKKLKFKAYGSDGSLISEAVLGEKGGLPAPGNYDSDSKADFGVVELVKGKYKWSYKSSVNGNVVSRIFGKAEDKVLAGCDFDGDGLSDLAVVRKKKVSSLMIRKSSGGSRSVKISAFPRSPKSLLCADLDGDHKAELLVIGRGGAELASARKQVGTKSSKSWQFLGFSATSGAQAFSRDLQKAASILVGDLNNDGIVDPGFLTKSGSDSTVNFFVGDATDASPVTLASASQLISGKFQSSSQGQLDGFATSASATGGQVSIFSLQSLGSSATSTSMVAGEKLVAPLNYASELKKGK